MANVATMPRLSTWRPVVIGPYLTPRHPDQIPRHRADWTDRHVAVAFYHAGDGVSAWTGADLKLVANQGTWCFYLQFPMTPKNPRPLTIPVAGLGRYVLSGN